MTTQEKLYSFLYKIRANPDTNTFHFRINKQEAEEAKKYFTVHGFNVTVKEKLFFGIGILYKITVERNKKNQIYSLKK